MSRKYFGTDGVRGKANSGAMTADMVLKIGMAAGNLYRRGSHRHRVVIGKDTRLSGYMIEQALTAGLLAAGMDVFLLGPVPTPAVAMLTRSMRADLGVMISASHNPYFDNGIKIFGPDGYKLSDEQELKIEGMVESPEAMPVANSDEIGRATRIEDAGARYIEFAKRTYPRDSNLDGLRIVDRYGQWRQLQDGAHGLVGAGRGNHPHRRCAQWLQHQREMRLNRAAGHVREGARDARRHRHCA